MDADADKRRKTEGSSEAKITHFPCVLVMDILSRLPIKSLGRCRCVCRSWVSLFSDPFFVNLQHERSPTRILTHHMSERKKLRVAHIAEDTGDENFQVDTMDFAAGVDLPDWTSDYACNGFLCLEDWEEEETYVCNPILGEYITIPSSTRVTKNFVYLFLGFSSASNQFKMLEINEPIDKPEGVSFMAEIYTIGDGARKWRSIGIAPSYPDCFSYSSTFLNGSIHWDDGKNYQFAYFDYEREQFGSQPLPNEYECDGKRLVWVNLGVLDGCLSVSLYSHNHPAEGVKIWVMKEYGVKESWTKMFSIHNLFERVWREVILDQNVLHPLFFLSLNNGMMLIWHYKGGVLCYDRESNQIHDTNIILGVGITYNPCFVSLMDVANGEELTVLPRRRATFFRRTWSVNLKASCRPSYRNSP